MNTLTIEGFDPQTTAQIEEVVDHLEGGHSDSVRFIAENLHNQGSLSEAQITRIDPMSVQFSVVTPFGHINVQAEFDKIVSTVPELRSQLLNMLKSARQAHPNHVLTSIEAELQANSKLVTWVGSVLSRRRIATNMVELTIGGLDSMPALGGDEFSYLMIPPSGYPNAIGAGMPYSYVDSLPTEQQPRCAYYTTRSRRIHSGEMDLWIYLHNHDGHEGDGVAAWAASVAVGAPVVLWGPRRAYYPPDDTEQILLVCDESGLAATAAIIDSCPSSNRVTLLAKLQATSHQPPRPTHTGLESHWFGPKSEGHDLVSAVRQLQPQPTGSYAFGAAESREISVVRRLLRNELNFPANQVHMTGYWRKQPLQAAV